jgi:cytochrome P450
MSAVLAPRASVAPFVDLEFLQDPYPAYRALREAGPIHWSEEFFGGAWLLTRHADVEAALRDPRLSAQRTGGWVMSTAHDRSELVPMQRLFSRAMLFLDAPAHPRLRRVLQPAFHPHALAELEPVVQRLAHELVDAISGRSADFMAGVARPLPALVIARLMGVDDALHDDFLRWSDDLAVFIGATHPSATQVRQAQRSLLAMADYFQHDLLPHRRRVPGNDLVSRLLQGLDAGTVHDHTELLAQCAMLLFAGYETTRNLLGNSLHALACQPEQWQRLLQQPAAVPNAVRELLRYDSPVQWSGRRVAQDLTLHGQQLLRGELVVALIGAANRDPLRHESPDCLDVVRSSPGTLSFGSGAHACLGAMLTQMEMQAVLMALLRRSPTPRLTGSPSRNGNPLYRGFSTLPMTL